MDYQKLIVVGNVTRDAERRISKKKGKGEVLTDDTSVGHFVEAERC